MRSEALNWLRKSESDLKHADYSYEIKDFDWAQIASQQAAEKALKATCIHKGLGLIKIHELTILARKVNAPQIIIMECGLLNPFYTSARYPDTAGFIDDDLNKEAAKDAISAARKVVAWCRKQIRI